MECPRTSFRDVLRVNVTERVWHSPPPGQPGRKISAFFLRLPVVSINCSSTISNFIALHKSSTVNFFARKLSQELGTLVSTAGDFDTFQGKK